jgi:PPOX class probable F420-dependent enzyme
MNPDECRSRAAGERSASLATLRADGAIDLLPIVFAVVGNSVVFAVDHKPKTTQRLQRLRNIHQQPNVTLLFDRYDEDWNQLWWVRMRGLAREVMDATERDAALDALVAKYEQYSDRRPAGPVVGIEPTEWHGWSGGPEGRRSD